MKGWIVHKDIMIQMSHGLVKEKASNAKMINKDLDRLSLIKIQSMYFPMMYSAI